MIEGACRHLVKDRCELTGMHWRVGGAECVLRLRSVCENGDWADFQSYCRDQESLRLYGKSASGERTTIERAAVPARGQRAEALAA